ncbi:hypothetical protein FISHEDRAFT_40284 [Fistulina hepatica ATCC 64428]|uniref:Cytochrome c oxidase assembly protein n=1 Tax=Fistulina hepatica ATCC 64428 TaxID=1128425 RepID=A0A0D7AGK4_9AGAR|nr:hypothetical protein FISHEDRAFT_40284 [Fistulina hepatica ATCC 64428]
MSSRAKVTLAATVVLSAFTIWGVHYLQHKELEDMYQGVLRDDVRRKEKMAQREADLMESRKKQALYESVQTVERQL